MNLFILCNVLLYLSMEESKATTLEEYDAYLNTTFVNIKNVLTIF